MKELLTLRNEQLRLQKDIETSHNSPGDQWHELMKSGAFLDGTVQLCDFIPCKDGKPLEKPDFSDGYCGVKEFGCEPNSDCPCYQEIAAIEKAYQQAQDAVIFEGWEWSKETPWIECDKWRIRFSTDRIFLDRNIGDNQFVGTVLNNPTYSDLAEATQGKPLKMRK